MVTVTYPREREHGRREAWLRNYRISPLDDLHHFCRSHHNGGFREMFCVSCYQKGIFLGQSHFIEYNVIHVGKIFGTVDTISDDAEFLDGIQIQVDLGFWKTKLRAIQYL